MNEHSQLMQRFVLCARVNYLTAKHTLTNVQRKRATLFPDTSATKGNRDANHDREDAGICARYRCIRPKRSFLYLNMCSVLQIFMFATIWMCLQTSVDCRSHTFIFSRSVPIMPAPRCASSNQVQRNLPTKTATTNRDQALCYWRL